MGGCAGPTIPELVSPFIAPPLVDHGKNCLYTLYSPTDMPFVFPYPRVQILTEPISNQTINLLLYPVPATIPLIPHKPNPNPNFNAHSSPASPPNSA